MLKKVVGICLGFLLLLSVCFAVIFPVPEMQEVRRIIYPYTIYALILEIVSLCGINFALQITFINQIKNKKLKIFLGNWLL